MRVLLGSVVVAIVLAGLAAYGHASSRLDAGMFGGIAVAVLVAGGVSAWAMHASRVDRRRRDERVAAVDAMFREFAARGTGEYAPGGAYHHSMIGTIPYCGCLRGDRWVVRLDEDEDGTRLEILVAEVEVANLRAIPKAAQAIVGRLRAANHRVAIRERPRTLLDPAARPDAMVRCLQVTSEPGLAAARVEAVLRDALALADAC